MEQGTRSVRASVWVQGGKSRRGGRSVQPSGLDRQRITDAAVRMLDDDGLEKLSMRRLAAELNVTAMSLYWYIDTKDDLLELLLDVAFGELRLPDPDAEDEDWRDQLRMLATEYRALLVRHTWLSSLVGRYLNIGPNALAFSRVILRVIRRAGLPSRGVMGAISAVFQFVYGYGMSEAHISTRIADSGLSADDYHEQALAMVAEAPVTAEAVKESEDLVAARGGDTVDEMLDLDFAFALDLLVAGIEAMAERG
ncbi:TetR/AcrR family transcriptional regulator [Streptomyces sp. NPDC094022]|uniref:TetR/AcrR family transcriptional regulator n=1 Tax=Streptomyces sp. NPDC094022 TaxID=3155206 RepID=UPI00332837FE